MSHQDKTQENRILELLESRGLSWTPAPELSHISLQYCRAISCLRRMGYAIQNKVEGHNGTRHGFYRLIKSAPVCSAPSEPPMSESLFGDIAADRSYRE